MRKDLSEARVAVDLYARLDALPVNDVERVRAKMQLARAEHVADLIARAIEAVRRFLRVRIVRPKAARSTASPRELKPAKCK